MRDALALFLHPELCFSGASERLMAIGHELRAGGFALCVTGRIGSRADMLRAEGWQVEPLELPRQRLLEPFAFARVRKMARRLDPRIVIATSAELAALAASLGRPYVLELDKEPPTRVPWNQRRLQAVVVPDATMVAAVVNRGGLPRRCVNVLRHGPEVGLEAAEHASLALARGGPLRIGCSGYLDEGHGTETLLLAQHELRQQGRDSELFVFGEGPLENRLRARARELNIAAHTTISAPAAPAAAELLATLDLYVSPMLERAPGWLAHLALALGLPTIVTAVSGAFDLVADGVDGLLVARGDGRELAQAIRRLADDPSAARALGARARARSLASGRQEGFRAGWRELLQRVTVPPASLGRRAP